MWFLLQVACRSHLVAALSSLPIESGDLAAVFPPDGSMRLRGDVPVEVVMGVASQNHLPKVTLTRNDETSSLTCVLGNGGNTADCGFIPAVEPDSDRLSLTVEAGADTLAVDPLNRYPEPGLGWSLLAGTQFTRLGSGTDAVTLVNGALVSDSAFVALDGYQGSEGSYTMVGGPSAVLPNGQFGIGNPGLGFVLPVDVSADGAISGTADTAWLPLPINNVVVHLLLLNLKVTAQLDGELLEDVSLTAELPALALEDLAASLGALGPNVLNVVVLDIDRNGDGTPDAASLELSGSPAPAWLSAW
jgi:hypothetical protein